VDNIIIAIARQYGSGGKTIGEMLAKDLGIHFYNREILRLASDDSGINERFFAQMDERVKNNLLFSVAKKVYNGELIPPDSDEFASSDNLFNYQAKVIKELAEQESMVVIGRCGDFVLKNHPRLISVFIHAPFDYCIERALERSALSRKEMEKHMARTDKQRGSYYKYHTGQIWSDARNYDLCLDSSKLGFEGCVKAIKSYRDIRFSKNE